MARKTEKLSTILKELDLDHLDLPIYVQNLLMYCGYDNYQSLSKIEANDIEKMEKFAQNDLANLLENHEQKEFYGIFAKNTKLFKIAEGHKKILNVICNSCKNHVKEQQQSKAKKRKLAPRQDLEKVKKNKQKNIGVKRLTNGDKDSSSEQTDVEENDAQTSEKIICHIQNIVTAYASKFLNSLETPTQQLSIRKENSLEKIKKIKVLMINGYPWISCTECSFQSRPYCNIENKKKKWVCSNFNRHFKTHFRNTAKVGKNVNYPKFKNSNILSYIKKIPQENSVIPSDIDPVELRIDTSNTESDICLLDDIVQNDSNNLLNILHNPMITGLTSDLSTDEPADSQSEISDLANLQNFEVGRTTREEMIDETSDETLTVKDGSSAAANMFPRPTVTATRQDRIKTTRLLTFDEHQLKITDFYEFSNKIQNVINNVPEIQHQFEQSIKIINEDHVIDNELSIKSGDFFEMLKTASKAHVNTAQAAHRFSEELKKLCLYLFLTSGRLAYETLSANMAHALPSLATLYRTLNTYGTYTEGEIKFKELKQFLTARNCPLKVFISEDQTAIVKRPRYDPSSNQLIGYVNTVSPATGFPSPNVNTINTLKDITDKVKHGILSHNAYVFMAQPLVDNTPAFCLTIFGSDNRFLSDDVLKRWAFIEELAKCEGIIIEGFASDGDTRCLKAMKITADLPISHETENKLVCPYFPYFQVSLFYFVRISVCYYF